MTGIFHGIANEYMTLGSQQADPETLRLLSEQMSAALANAETPLQKRARLDMMLDIELGL